LAFFDLSAFPSVDGIGGLTQENKMLGRVFESGPSNPALNRAAKIAEMKREQAAEQRLQVYIRSVLRVGDTVMNVS
jgi:hypothetical protein